MCRYDDVIFVLISELPRLGKLKYDQNTITSPAY